jgi:branched-chain amino acid transport system ATP-binding protein
MTPLEPILILRNVESGYHNKNILRGLNFTVYKNQVTAVIGHNGAGKTTLLRTIFRLIPVQNGEIWYTGKNVTHTSTSENQKLGISYVPQERAVFPNLTVRENLDLSFYFSHRNEENRENVMEEVLNLFPALSDRLASRALTLSGGLKQMLAIGMALSQHPSLLLSDEPSLGLGPIVVQNLMRVIKTFTKTYSTSVILVEQNIKEALNVSERVCIMKMGDFIYDGPVTSSLDTTVIFKMF